MRCEVEEISKDEFNSFVTISCTTAEAGKFAIQVENDERFFDRAEGFVINHAVQPRITSVKDGSFNISSIKNFSVEFGATGIDDSSVVRLVPKSESEKEKPVTRTHICVCRNPGIHDCHDEYGDVLFVYAELRPGHFHR